MNEIKKESWILRRKSLMKWIRFVEERHYLYEFLFFLTIAAFFGAVFFLKMHVSDKIYYPVVLLLFLVLGFAVVVKSEYDKVKECNRPDSQQDTVD